MESIWKRTKMPVFSQLPGDTKTDVLIIGGGMAGLLCARFLRSAGVSCIVAEAGRIAGGITAGTTAKVTSQHGLIYRQLTNRFDISFAAPVSERQMPFSERPFTNGNSWGILEKTNGEDIQMLTNTRHEQILKLLEQRGSISLQDLKELLHTSESTIRRDLSQLHEQGRLVKVFGGAVACEKLDQTDVQVPDREIQNREEKQKIAAYGAKLVRNRDFVPEGDFREIPNIVDITREPMEESR